MKDESLVYKKHTVIYVNIMYRKIAASNGPNEMNTFRPTQGNVKKNVEHFIQTFSLSFALRVVKGMLY